MMVRKHILRNYLVTLCSALSMVIYGYDESFFSSMQVLPFWLKYFDHPSPALIGAVNTGYTVGAIVCGFFISPIISDKFGRKWALGSGSAVVIVASIIMALAPNIAAFIAARTISGMGQGLMLPAGPVYIGEMVYPGIRGRLMSLWQIGYAVGSIISTYTTLGCVYSPHLGVWQWRIVVLLQIVTPAVLISGLAGCPETPRWYLQHGSEEKARQSLSTVRLPEEVDFELSEIRNAIREQSSEAKYKQLVRNKSYRIRLLLAIGLNVGQKFTGSVSLNQYSGIILKQVFSSSQTVILMNAIIAIFSTLSPFTAFFLIDKLGRRPLFMASSVGLTLTLFTMATVVTQTPEEHGHHTLPVGVGVIILVCVFQLCFGPGWGGAVWIWTSEVWPVAVRANAVAIASQSQQISSAILGQIFPLLFAAARFYIFYFYAGTNILLGLFVWFFIKETKGVALEHMEDLFGGVDHVLAGEQYAMKAVAENDVDIGAVRKTVPAHVEVSTVS